MQYEVGKIVDGVVTGITKYGAFVDIGDGQTGLVHISEISTQYVNDVSEHLQNGQSVKVKILGINDRGRFNLSIRKALPTELDAGRTKSFNRAEKSSFSGANRGLSAQKYDNRNNRRDREESASSRPSGFEDMLSKFMHSSDEKLSDMRKQPSNRRGAYQKKESHK